MEQENEILKRLQNGDKKALDEIIRLYYPEIFRYCIWHTPNREMAEDATQETFVKAIRHMDSYVHCGKFKAYLYKIAINTCNDFWRHEKKSIIPETEEYTEKGFEQVESKMAMTKLLSGLSAGQQELIVLRYVHELKIREIAEILNLPIRTVQSRLRAALKKLKRNYRKEHCENEQKLT